MPLPDYYQILGVSSSATVEEIKKAYRKLAFHNHPDRGGSHDRMLAINEAFLVLANASARADYDQSRSAQASLEIRQRAEQYSSKAASVAGDYPRNYEEFEGWADSIVKDFADARYGSDQWGAFRVPTVENSTSGGLFLLIGAVAGGYLGWMLFGSLTGAARAFTVMWTIIGGAWIGQLLHAGVKATVVGNQPACAANRGDCASAVAPGTVEKQLLVVCPKCSQKLRAGIGRVGAQLRCPQCRTEFTMR